MMGPVDESSGPWSNTRMTDAPSERSGAMAQNRGIRSLPREVHQVSQSTSSIPSAGSASLLTHVVNEFEHNTDEEARKAATDSLASSSGAVLFPCVVFRQGGRLNISTAFPMNFIAQHVRPEPASKGGDPRAATNRPLMPDHVKSIFEYLDENHERYILPPVTLNVRRIPQVHVPRSNSAVRAGYLVIPYETIFYVTDGMHRVAAIAGFDSGSKRTPGILEWRRDELSGDAVAVVIVVESELPQIHQDFADAAHTKPIPASLLAAYNTREPVNQVLQEVVKNSLFASRIDETSKTLSKLSNHMFLLNQVRTLLKGLLVGDYAIADSAFERRASQDFKDQQARDGFVARTLDLLSVLTAEMEPWNQIAESSPADPSGNLVMNLRPLYLNLSATGLAIIGQVAHRIERLAAEKKIDRDRRHELFSKLAQIDWRRDAPLWQGTAIQDGKLATNRFAVNAATNAVKQQLGVAVDD